MNLQNVLDAALERKPGAPSDLTKMIPTGERHPFDRQLGPLKARGKPSGIVSRRGEVLGSYGDCETPEVTFSVSKSYISAVAGIAVRDGLLNDLNEPVCHKVADGFESEHNQQITWRHLLQQNSDWEGETFGIPDWIDRGRALTGGGGRVGDSATATEDDHRPSERPGSYFEYNDVRVNRLSLALLNVFREPLPEVLKREIMIPIGASDSWAWHGYENSWVEINSQQMQSVSGGAHWGGGLWINTQDHLKFGELFLNEGNCQGEPILPKDWIYESTTPSKPNPNYGYLWWLNQDGAISKTAGHEAYAARGAGGHMIFIWPEEEIVIVLRWCDDPREVVDQILGCL